MEKADLPHIALYNCYHSCISHTFVLNSRLPKFSFDEEKNYTKNGKQIQEKCEGWLFSLTRSFMQNITSFAVTIVSGEKPIEEIFIAFPMQIKKIDFLFEHNQQTIVGKQILLDTPIESNNICMLQYNSKIIIFIELANLNWHIIERVLDFPNMNVNANVNVNIK